MVTTGSEVRPISYFMGTWEVNYMSIEGDHSQAFSAEVKNEWSSTFTPPICLQGTDRDNFTFTDGFIKQIIIRPKP